MKFLLALSLLGLLPAWCLGQHRAAPPKVETAQVRYARLDQYARQLPESQAVSLEKLAASLATQARTDDDKARLIFAWLAYHIAYDVGYLRGDTAGALRHAPDHVLRSRKAICQGYADLFTDLATRLKLDACTVTGHARDWSMSGNLLGEANGHAWNAYRVAGTWHLADATWGAGGTGLDNNAFKQEFDPFWFDISPSQAIFTHLPEEAVWQLLPEPVAPAAFQGWPYVEPAWFQLLTGRSLLRVFSIPKSHVNRLPTIEVKRAAPKVQVVQVPLHRELLAGQPVRFVFQAPAEISLSIEMDTSYAALKPNGRYQQAIVTPAPGRLTVSAWHKADTAFVFSLQYEVVPVPRPKRLHPGEHRTVPKDSVVYLRR